MWRLRGGETGSRENNLRPWSRQGMMVTLIRGVAVDWTHLTGFKTPE